MNLAPKYLSLLISSTLMTGAYAQVTTQGNEPVKPLDTVTITAQKRDQIAQEVPIAVTVVGADFLQKSGGASLKDIVSAMPSVQFTQSQSQIQSTVSIRGVGSGGGVAGLEPSVGLYVDGIYLDRTAMGIGDFNDIERIEVLKGPQGTLFGKNTPAGVVNFITKRPGFQRGGEAELTLGNYGLRKAALTATTPLIDDKLAVRITGFNRQRNGVLQNTWNGESVNNANASGLRARALWMPTSNVDVLVTVERGIDNQNCCAPDLDSVSAGLLAGARTIGKPFPSVLNNADRLTSFNSPFKNNISTNAYSLESNWNLGDYTVTGLFSLRKVAQRGSIDADFTQLDLLAINDMRDYSQKSAELRIASPADRPFNYVAGVYYFNKSVTEAVTTTALSDIRVLNPGLVAGRSSQSGSVIDNTSYAMFGQATYELTKKFDVSAGLRYTYDDKKLTAQQVLPNGGPFVSRPWGPVAESQSGGNTSGMVNARYRWDKDSMAYASLTRGYKAFGFNDGDVPAGLGQKRFFDAELSNSVEVGVKKEWANRTVTTNVAIFRTKFDNYQASSFSPNPNGGTSVFLLQNAGKLTTQGLELELSARPIRGASAGLAYTYLNAKFNDFKTGPGITGVSTTQDLSGRTLANAPTHSLSLTGQYRWALSGTALTAFTWGELSRRSQYFTSQNLDPRFLQPAYTQINARAGIEGKAWSLELWGRNLTDKNVLYAGGPGTVGGLVYFNADPRTYGMTVRLKF